MTYLIEICLQEVHLLRSLQQSWPVLLLKLLLAEHNLDVLACVVDLALVWVDLGVEFKLNMVRLLLRRGLAIEGQAGWLQVELEVFWGAIWDGDGEVNVVLRGIGGIGALSPQDCNVSDTSIS